MTKTQAATLARITELTASGPLDVTYGGIKGVNRTSLWCLEEMGVIVIERTTVDGRLRMLATVAKGN
jgi:hypothetical protein